MVFKKFQISSDLKTVENLVQPNRNLSLKNFDAIFARLVILREFICFSSCFPSVMTNGR